MRHPRIQDLKRPKDRPANDDWPPKNAAPTARRPPMGPAVTRLILIVSGLAIASCLLGIGIVELVLRWT
jgi:hypothetical protein